MIPLLDTFLNWTQMNADERESEMSKVKRETHLTPSFSISSVSHLTFAVSCLTFCVYQRPISCYRKSVR